MLVEPFIETHLAYFIQLERFLLKENRLLSKARRQVLIDLDTQHLMQLMSFRPLWKTAL